MKNSLQSCKYIVTCQVHPALVKRVQCTVHSSFLNFWVVITSPPVNGPKDPWPCVVSLPGTRVVCWRPHPACVGDHISNISPKNTWDHIFHTFPKITLVIGISKYQITFNLTNYSIKSTNHFLCYLDPRCL